MRKLQLLMIGVVASCHVAAGEPARAEDERYPRQSVKVIVPFSAGGPLDLTARLITNSLTARLKQPFIVENRPGASGDLGVAAAVQASPDGYTLLMTLDPPLTANQFLQKERRGGPLDRLLPIAFVAGFSQMLVVHPSLEVYSLADFVSFARSGTLLYGGGGGRGNPGYLTMEYFASRAGLHTSHVPYKGNPELVSDLLAGHIKASFIAAPSVTELVKRGELRGIAVSGAKRLAVAPDVPTLAESGYAGFDVSFGLLLLAQSATPNAIRDILEREVMEVVNSSEFRASLAKMDLEFVGRGSDFSREWLNKTSDMWRSLIEGGAQAEKP